MREVATLLISAPNYFLAALMQTVDLSREEWLALGRLPVEVGHGNVSELHRQKLLRLGLASEKAGRLIATFNGRLMLREHNTPSR